jgi:hypothetical protein
VPRLLLAIAVVAGMAAPARPAAADPALRALVREWHERLVRLRPDLASRLGAPRTSDRLWPVGETTLARDAAWIPAFRARVAALAPAPGTPAAADRDALLAWCAAESAAVSPGGRWWRDPGAYVEMIADAVAEPATARRPGACDRARRTARRLAAVPEVLRSAQVVLRTPHRDATRRAADRLDSLLADWRTPLPGRFVACREAYRQADLIEADTLALQAGAAFLHWLRDDAARHATDGEPPAAATPLPRLWTKAR